MNDYMDSIIYVVAYEEVFDRRGGATINAEMFSPKVISLIKNTFSHRLFSKACEFLQPKYPSVAMFKIISGQGRSLGDGLYELSLRHICPYLEINMAEVEHSMMLALGMLYRREYNLAIEQMTNRESQVTRQGYLDFELEV